MGNSLGCLQVLSLEIDRERRKLVPRLHWIETGNTLQALRKIISCDLVTCTEINVGGNFYDVWSDDEGMLTDKPIPTLYLNDNLVLFGNLVFATNTDGETTGLDDADIAILLKFLGKQTPKLHHWFMQRFYSRCASQL